MFCLKCGLKLSDKDGKCTNCGAENRIDRCGGFFGLINQQIQQSNPTPQRLQPESDLGVYFKHKKEEEEELMRKKALIVVSIICVVLLAVVLIQASRLNVLLEQNEDVQRSISKLEDAVSGNNDRNEDNRCDFCDSCLHLDETGITYEQVEGEEMHEVCCECGAKKGIIENCEGVFAGLSETQGHHKLVCSKCGGDMGEEACSFSEEDGKCKMDGCTNECEHDFKFESNPDNKSHELKCEECGHRKTEECTFEEEDGNCQVKGCPNKAEESSEDNSII